MSNRINFKAVDVSYHIFFQARQERVMVQGIMGGPCQPVLLHASLPISLATSAPNKQVTNELVHLASFLYHDFPVKTITHFYVPEVAIQRQEVTGRRRRDKKTHLHHLHSCSNSSH